MDNNYYHELVDNLVKGNLTLKDIQLAYRESIRKREDLPSKIKDVLCGKEETEGIIGDAFKLISEIEGATYLSYMIGAILIEGKMVQK